MGYLAVAVLCFSALTIVTRYTVGRGVQLLAVHLVIRATGVVSTLAYLLVRGQLANVFSHWQAAALLGGVGAASYWLAGFGSGRD